MMKTKKRFLVLTATCLLGVSLPITAFAASNKPAGMSSHIDSSHIGVEAAKTVALEHAGASSEQVAFTKTKLDYDDGAYEYEIKFTWSGTRYKYEIGAVSGKITSYSQKVQKQPNTTSTASTSDISIEKAKEIALTHAGVSASEATFTKAKLDYDDGIAEYEIEFYAGGTEYEFEINASTGKILDYDVEAHEGRRRA